MVSFFKRRNYELRVQQSIEAFLWLCLSASSRTIRYLQFTYVLPTSYALDESNRKNALCHVSHLLHTRDANYPSVSLFHLRIFIFASLFARFLLFIFINSNWVTTNNLYCKYLLYTSSIKLKLFKSWFHTAALLHTHLHNNLNFTI